MFHSHKIKTDQRVKSSNLRHRTKIFIYIHTCKPGDRDSEFRNILYMNFKECLLSDAVSQDILIYAQACILLPNLYYFYGKELERKLINRYVFLDSNKSGYNLSSKALN